MDEDAQTFLQARLEAAKDHNAQDGKLSSLPTELLNMIADYIPVRSWSFRSFRLTCEMFSYIHEKRFKAGNFSGRSLSATVPGLRSIERALSGPRNTAQHITSIRITFPKSPPYGRNRPQIENFLARLTGLEKLELYSETAPKHLSSKRLQKAMSNHRFLSRLDFNIKEFSSGQLKAVLKALPYVRELHNSGPTYCTDGWLNAFKVLAAGSLRDISILEPVESPNLFREGAKYFQYFGKKAEEEMEGRQEYFKTEKRRQYCKIKQGRILCLCGDVAVKAGLKLILEHHLSKEQMEEIGMGDG